MPDVPADRAGLGLEIEGSGDVHFPGRLLRAFGRGVIWENTDCEQPVTRSGCMKGSGVAVTDRWHEVLALVSEAILRASTPDEVFRQACELLVGVGGCDAALPVGARGPIAAGGRSTRPKAGGGLGVANDGGECRQHHSQRAAGRLRFCLHCSDASCRFLLLQEELGPPPLQDAAWKDGGGCIAVRGDWGLRMVEDWKLLIVD